jgi:acyl CoA:acetate/3-ketoacid CoA transferase beta subunit
MSVLAAHAQKTFRESAAPGHFSPARAPGLYTDLAVFERSDRKSPLRLLELAPGVTAEEVRRKTSAGFPA